MTAPPSARLDLRTYAGGGPVLSHLTPQLFDLRRAIGHGHPRIDKHVGHCHRMHRAGQRPTQANSCKKLPRSALMPNCGTLDKPIGDKRTPFHSHDTAEVALTKGASPEQAIVLPAVRPCSVDTPPAATRFNRRPRVQNSRPKVRHSPPQTQLPAILSQSVVGRTGTCL